LKAVLTAKHPLESGSQMSLSGLGLEGIGMDRIAWAELGLKRCRTREDF